MRHGISRLRPCNEARVSIVSPCSLPLRLWIALATTLLLFLMVTASSAQSEPSSLPCPIVCQCKRLTTPQGSGLEISATCGKGAPMLDIFTQLDPASTRWLLLSKVKGFGTLDKTRMDDLAAKQLVKLRITNSAVKTIEDGVFLQLPDVTDLDLSQNQISTLKAGSLEGLESLRFLNLSHNQLSHLGSTVAHLDKLTSLDLSANSFKDIPEGTFINLSSLTTLKLDRNPLRTLHVGSFSGLSSLRELSMRDCALTKLDGEMFAHLPSLAILNLGHNRLQSCPPAAGLSGLTNLQSVFLDHNEVSVLEGESFAGIKLHMIDLSYNRIRELGADTFTGASLVQIDLSHNLLLSLSAGALTPLDTHVSSLSLAGNPLRTLQPGVFSPLEVLATLNLSACQLENLPHDVMNNMKSLKQLDLSHNNIPFLSEGTLGLLEKVDTLEVTGNPWVCDCSIGALKDWLGKASNSGRLSCHSGGKEEDGGGHSSKGDDCVKTIMCAAPSRLRDQQVALLSEEELAMCERDESSTVPASTQGAIVAFCMGFAIVLLIITIYLWRRGKTVHGLKRVCVPSDAESSHKDNDDEDDKIPPLPDCKRNSLTHSDHNFVFRHYFDHLVTDPKLMSDDAEDLEEGATGDDVTAPLSKKERDSQYSSQNSLYSTHSDAAYGMESTV